MNIVHIVDFIYGSNNGIQGVVIRLQKEQILLGHEVHIFNIAREEVPLQLKGRVRSIFSIKEFRDAIDAIHPGVVVFHSLYKLKYSCFANYLKKINIPYLIEPHGATTLENAAKSKFKKKIANLLIFNSFIRNAQAMIYLNKYECNKCVFYRIRRNSSIIPNGIDIPTSSIEETKTEEVNKIHFTFLARIDIHHKGIDILLDAIDILIKKGYQDCFVFNFYGSAKSEKDLRYLKKKIASFASNIFYNGPVTGLKKEKAFFNTDVYVLTSRYEGMPLSVLEALSYGIPCVVTPQTNVQDIILESGSGWVTVLEPLAIADTLILAMNDVAKQRKNFILRSKTAIRKFAWNVIGSRSLIEYSKYEKVHA